MEEQDVWTVGRILAWIESFLSEKGDAQPRMSAQWLVAEALQTSRIALYADLDRPLTDDERALLRDFTRRRAQGEPLQYITGSVDFRFVTIKVRSGVLIPRPETEVLVSEALGELKPRLDALRKRAQDERDALRSKALLDALREGTPIENFGSIDPHILQMLVQEGDTTLSEEALREKSSALQDELSQEVPGLPLEQRHDQNSPIVRVVDVCTGSGCIACALASEVPFAEVIATDISKSALELASENVESLNLSDRVQVVQGDLLEPLLAFRETETDASLKGTIDLIISNPPYIPSSVLETMDTEVTAFEPRLALDGGQDGLKIFDRLLPQAFEMLTCGGVLAVELHEDCLEEALIHAERAGFDHLRWVADLAGRPRVLIGRKPEQDAFSQQTDELHAQKHAQSETLLHRISFSFPTITSHVVEKSADQLLDHHALPTIGQSASQNHPPLSLLVLASGSSGNAAFVFNERTARGALIDCGVPKRVIVEGLERAGLSLSCIDAVFITHEHNDHVRGAGVLFREFARRGLSVKLCVAHKVLEASRSLQEAALHADVVDLSAGSALSIAGMQWFAFATSHDAVASFGFRVTCETDVLGYLTDSGIVTGEAHEALSQVRMLALETNHDRDMLEKGPYPYMLKRRIAGDRGHLSNEQAAQELEKLLHPGLSKIVGMHISQENNLVSHAQSALCRVLAQYDHPASVCIARQHSSVLLRS